MYIYIYIEREICVYTYDMYTCLVFVLPMRSVTNL